MWARWGDPRARNSVNRGVTRGAGGSTGRGRVFSLGLSASGAREARGGAGARRHPCLHLARDGRRLPRVRALRDHDRGRLFVAAVALVPREAVRAGGGSRPSSARDHAERRWRRGRCDSRPPWLVGGAQRGGGGGGGGP